MPTDPRWTDRQAHAFAHPITDPAGALDPALRRIRTTPRGVLMTILAVDR